jgi:hypothetical protein
LGVKSKTVTTEIDAQVENNKTMLVENSRSNSPTVRADNFINGELIKREIVVSDKKEEAQTVPESRDLNGKYENLADEANDCKDDKKTFEGSSEKGGEEFAVEFEQKKLDSSSPVSEFFVKKITRPDDTLVNGNSSVVSSS